MMDSSNSRQQEGLGSPMSSSASLIGDSIAGSMSGSNKATTTERRTTTTTTTKRTVKSSDDSFMPSQATEVQQVRSESRTGSISSGAPIYSSMGAGPANLASTGSSTASSSSTTTTHHCNTSNASKQQQQQQQDSATNKQTSNWSESMQSPVVEDTEEGRVLKLRFDVSQYEPDEIVVKTLDNRLTVHAKHEERSENRTVYREYNREFHLPDGTDIEQIKSSLAKDGLLTVRCPLPAPQVQGSTRRIPIEKV